jgi:hypothetical protein
VLALLLQANLTPWVEASDVMRRVTHTYASTFGMGSGERIERLPARHHGVYMALYNVDGFSPQFLPGKRPKLQAVVESRAAYFGLERNMRMLPDPVFGSADRLEADRTTAEWLFPVDGSALDAASLEGLERVPGVPSGRQFRTLGRASWLITRPPADQPPLSHAPGSEEVAYLLIRPAPPDAPNLFWSAEDEPFGDPRWVVLEREMALQDGRVAPRAVNGFAVYAYPLHEHRYWPGMERITSLRLDPHFSTEPFEIGFFGIARRK